MWLRVGHAHPGTGWLTRPAAPWRQQAPQSQQTSGIPPSQRCRPCSRVHAAPLQDPYRLLQVERSSSRAEVRAAYIEQIKLLHPDLNPDQDTTEAAAALNVAYESILTALENGGRARGSSRDEWDDRLDVFDRPEAPPTEVFVNPFACYNVSPLMWEELQQAVAGTDDPEAALSQAGVSFSEGFCVAYLSPQQLAVLQEELERMRAAMDTISIEVAGFFVRDCLLRARVANNRMAGVRY